MTEAFRIEDRGDRRVLWVGEPPSMPTHYSERVIRMLVERKGADRAPLYFPFKADARRTFWGRCSATCARAVPPAFASSRSAARSAT